jgi:hypothetical protein
LTTEKLLLPKRRTLLPSPRLEGADPPASKHLQGNKAYDLPQHHTQKNTAARYLPTTAKTRPPTPLSLGGASKKGTTPERCRLPSQSFWVITRDKQDREGGIYLNIAMKECSRRRRHHGRRRRPRVSPGTEPRHQPHLPPTRATPGLGRRTRRAWSRNLFRSGGGGPSGQPPQRAPIRRHHAAHTAMEYVLQAPMVVAHRQVDAALSA